LSLSEDVSAFGIACRVLTLEGLIQLKRAAGRLKDAEVLAELQALAEEPPARRPAPPQWEVML
jgi:hypothetical protein